MVLVPKKRIESLDLLKGLVMVIMALDHVRDYFHYSSYFFDPADPAQTTIPIFFTRFITNFCAPAFSFLAGISAFIIGRRKSRPELARFLLQRGCWLIFVELMIMSFGWHFDIYFHDTVFQVIWSLGISMIFLAGLIYLPARYILVFSCVLIFGHNLLDHIHDEGNVWWAFLHERKRFDTSPGRGFSAGYPIIPWVAVMSLGYYFGRFYNPDYDYLKRKKLFNAIGISALLLLLILRATNVYGNILPWKNYGSAARNIMSFLNLSKYPPSLSFLLSTLGVTFLFLANAENLRGKLVDFFSVFGRVPFFYYILHIYLVHGLAMLFAEWSGFGWKAMILPLLPFRVTGLRGFGVNLVIVYLIWIAVILLLYPLCKWFDKYKQAHKDKWWLSYL